MCLISDQGELVDRFTATPDRDGLYGLARRVAVYGEVVRSVVESMNGARFVHDELVAHGWEVLVADAQKVKGLAPLACRTDKIDSGVLAELSFRDLVPAIWLPTFALRQEREISRWRLHLVKHRSTLKNRVHSTSDLSVTTAVSEFPGRTVEARGISRLLRSQFRGGALPARAGEG